MRFDLVIMGLKGINRGVRLIFTTLMRNYRFALKDDYFGFCSNNLFRHPKSMYNINMKLYEFII